jgi:hypothetical protein
MTTGGLRPLEGVRVLEIGRRLGVASAGLALTAIATVIATTIIILNIKLIADYMAA